MSNRYGKMTTEEFDRLLREVIDETIKKPSDLLSVTGVYEHLAEEFNNEVLDAWELEQAEKETE